MAAALGDDKALFAQCDVASEDQIVSAIQAAQSKWPNVPIGGLVNCGGLSGGQLTIDHEGHPASLDYFQHLVQVNLIGSFNLSRLVAAEMARQGGGARRGSSSSPGELEERGSILLVASTSYQDPQPGLAGYAASKGGVASLVLPLSQDLARFGIRVNAVAPSLFETAMGAGLAPRARKVLESRFVFPKRGQSALRSASCWLCGGSSFCLTRSSLLAAGQPEEFAHLAKAIAENTYINGSVIRCVRSKPRTLRFIRLSLTERATRLDGGTRMSKL